jgi:hypothetical protein
MCPGLYDVIGNHHIYHTMLSSVTQFVTLGQNFDDVDLVPENLSKFYAEPESKPY